MKLVTIFLLLTSSLVAEAYYPRAPRRDQPRSPVRGAIEGSWEASVGGWPDGATVRMAIGRSQTTFETKMLTAGFPCVATLTVPTSYDAGTFSVLSAGYAQGRAGFGGQTCDVRAERQTAYYELNGRNELTIRQPSGAATTYRRVR